MNHFINIKKLNFPKTLFVLTFTAFFAGSLLSPIFTYPYQALAITPPDVNAYTIIFNGVTYDNQNYTSTWSYTVTKTGEGHNLSHWVWEPCFSQNELIIRFINATPAPSEVGYDPSTGHYGVKWEVGENFVEGTFTVTIKGQPVVDADGATGVIKAADNHFEQTIPGPDCTTYTIAGKKFEDKDCDGEWDHSEDLLGGWKITIEDPGQFSDFTTTFFGLYFFSNLYSGTYIVCEVLQKGWEQTYPTENSGCHIIEITNSNVTGINFGNRQIPEGPYCGDGILDEGEECDDGLENGIACTPPYGDECTYCSETCTLETIEGPYCGDGIQNGNEECDGSDGVPPHHTCTEFCTLEYIPYCGDGEVNQQSEGCDGDCPRLCTTQEGYSGYQSCIDCLWGECVSEE